MLKFWIFISNLFVASLGTDVLFSVSKTCFSSGEDMELSAEYTGNGTVNAVQWYYSGQVNTGNNLIVRASTCTIFGTADAGYPSGSRMAFTCPPATSKFTLTLTGLQSDEFGKVWGATFSLTAGSSPTVQQESINLCEKCTCDCRCKKKCKGIVIPSIVFGGLGAATLPVVIGGTVTEHFGRTTALVVDGIGIVFDVISSVLGIVVQGQDCCKDAEDCCEDSDCCEVECEKNWIETTAIVFIILGCLLAIVGGVIFYLVWSGRIGPGNNAYKAKEAKEPGENHGMTGTSM